MNRLLFRPRDVATDFGDTPGDVVDQEAAACLVVLTTRQLRVTAV